METMYAPQNNSPKATLVSAINATATTITVDDASIFLEAPNVLTIGTGEDAELVQYTNITGNILTVVRGFNGTTAKSWNAGIYLYRAITAQDVSALQANVAEVDTNLTDHVDNTTIHVTAEDKSKWNNPPKAPVQSVFGRTGAVVAQTGDYTHEQVGAAPATHASQHASTGDDPVTPASIGAASTTHAATHGEDGSDPISPASIGAAPSIHASQHAENGSDPITPASIGAASDTHASTHGTSGSDPIAPASIGAANQTHASTHHTGGSDPLTASSIGAATPPDVSSITLTSAGWTGEASPYTQAVTLAGVTANTKVDLQPDAATISQLITDTVAGMYIANDGGTLTAYAVNAKPTTDLTIQVTLTETTGG